MKKSFLAFCFALLSLSTEASDICNRGQADIRSFLEERTSRIAFRNDGGLFNQGVCWWHSRLQRSSTYLVTYEPAALPPTRPELLKILTDLRDMNKTVVIPGYENFETFTHDFQNDVQAMLNGWQKIDGFYNFEWLRGISGRSSLPAGEMVNQMKSVYTHYKNSPAPLWIMAQIKGISSHSLLILRMKEISQGYEMQVIDSNHPDDNITITYHHGDTFLRAPGEKYSFVPYVGFQNDFKKLDSALRARCGEKNLILDLKEMKPGEVEL